MTQAHASGLDTLLASEGSAGAPFERKMGLVLVEASRGRALFRATPDNANMSGAMHGGWIAGLFDAVTGAAVATLLAPGETYATVSMHVSYLRGVTEGMVVDIEGCIVKEGGRMIVSRASVSCEGKEMARADATCMRIVERRA